MKKIAFLALGICCVFQSIGQSQKYTLPYELSNIQPVAVHVPLADVTGKAYIELTSILSGLHSDLVAQEDGLQLVKNLQQKFQSMGVEFNRTSYYSDRDSLAMLKESYENAIRTVSVNLITINKNISTINSDISKINNTINDRMNTEKAQQEFRKWTSVIFAGLLAIIIGCFFIVIFKSNSAQTASILMGESGLQFITLFSIIISIILFGVLNILEGKELSAILSAIAGFILGKYNPDKSKNQPPSVPQSPPAP